MDAEIDAALAMLDQDERFDAYKALQAEIADLAPSIFVYDQVEKHGHQTYLDWPAARGEVIPMMGYNILASRISVNK